NQQVIPTYTPSAIQQPLSSLFSQTIQQPFIQTANQQITPTYVSSTIQPSISSYIPQTIQHPFI
ncbi:unnamed protein product, partial [Rotaria sp. Silwood1]